MATTHFYKFAVTQHDASFIIKQFNLPSTVQARLTPQAWRTLLAADTSPNLVSKPLAQADALLLGANRLVAMQMVALWMLMFVFYKSTMNNTLFHTLVNL
jgi:hypothetical protein